MLAAFLRDGRTSTSGVSVTEMMALRNSTFFRAANLIASSIGMLPSHLMRRTVDASARRRSPRRRITRFTRVLHKRPNGYQTAFEFKAYMQLLALLDGNAYALIVRGFVRGKKDQIVQLVPLKRRSVTPKLSSDWQLTFEYQRPSGGKVTLQASEVSTSGIRSPAMGCKASIWSTWR